LILLFGPVIFTRHVRCFAFASSHQIQQCLLLFGFAQTQTGQGDRPLAEIRINRVTIHANPLAG